MKVETQQLIAFILDAGLATKDQLDAAQQEANKNGVKVDDVLIEKKIVSEEQLIKLKAYILGIPFVSLEKENIPLEVLQIIPEPIAHKYSIVAFRKTGSELEVAMTDPEDIQTIEFIHKKANLTILPRLTNSKGIAAVLKQYQKSLEEEFSDLFAPRDIEVEEKEAGELTSLEGKFVSAPKDEEGGNEKVEELAKAAEDLPVIKIV